MSRFQLSDDTKRILDFLSCGGLYGYFWTQGATGSYKISSWFPAGESRGFPMTWLDNSWNVYFGVNPVNKVKSNTQRAELPDIASTRAFFAEFDAKIYGSKEAIIDHIENLRISGTPKPSLIIDSGGGYHCYWFFREPIAITEANFIAIKCRLYAWIDHTRGDDNSKDLCRVLRVPGTRNFKPDYAPAFPEVEIYDLDWDALYTLEELEHAMHYDPAVENIEERPQVEAFDVDDKRKRAYCLAGLEKEAGRVKEAKQGNRNNTIFQAAANVGELIAIGGISDAEAEAELLDAALVCGCSKEEATASIKSGFKHGKTQPRNIAHTEAFKAEIDYYANIAGDPDYLPMLLSLETQPSPEAPTMTETKPEPTKPTGKAIYGSPADAVTSANDHWLIIKEEDINLDELNRFDASDEGNARALLHLYRKRFAFNESFAWLYFDGTKWTTEGAYQKVRRAATETLYWRSKAADRSASLNGKMFKQNCSPISNIVTQLETLVFVSPSKFDRKPYHLNTVSGLINLKTGKLEPHNPDHYLTHCIDVQYNMKADPTVFHDWLTEVCGQEQADWLKRVCGYAILGDPIEEILIYIYGPSRSGKGTFTETIQAVLGSPLSKETKFSTFVEDRNGDSQNFDLAELAASRFIVANEGKEHERLNAAKIKAVTGGGDVMCSRKHKDPFWYKPQYAIFLASNFLPNISPDDDAAWGRLRLVSFPNSHLGTEDKTLKRTMRSQANLEGVLLWLVQGAQEYLALGNGGLKELESSRLAKNSQASLLDNVGAWLDECVAVTGDEADFTSFTDLMESYLAWCKKSGVTAKTSQGFSRSLERKRAILDKECTFTPYIKATQRVDKSRSTTRGYKGMLIP